MTLGEQQEIYSLNIAKLIIYAYEIGYKIRKGEGLRTKSQQYLYFEGYKLIKIGSAIKLAKTSPKSKTMNSMHLLKLADDLNVMFKVKLLGSKDKKLFKPLADYWRALHIQNVSGYDWGGYDMNHFQMTYK